MLFQRSEVPAKPVLQHNAHIFAWRLEQSLNRLGTLVRKGRQ